MKILFLIFALVIFLSSHGAHAHKASDSYLTINIADKTLTGHWDIALRDLDAAIGLDSNANGELTWAEVRSAHPRIAQYATDNLSVQLGNTRCDVKAGSQTLVEHTDGLYTRVPLENDCKVNPADIVSTRYTLMNGTDPQHRGLLALTQNGVTTTLVLNPNDTTTQAASTKSSFFGFIKEGVHHIVIGLDHVLFIALLVAATLRTYPDSPRAAFVPLLKVVTAFTVAHSLTLALSLFGWVNLPTRLVETLIAATVCLCAVDILRPFLKGPRWLYTFGFGLLHGLGLASALTALSLPASARVVALFGFNVGVEIGQLVIALAAFGLLYAGARITRNPIIVARYAAVPIAAVAAVWMLERSLDTKWLPL